MSLFPHTCRDVTRLVLERDHRRLHAVERAAVGLHLGICRGCRRFGAQLRLMDRALARWKTGEPDQDTGPN